MAQQEDTPFDARGGSRVTAQATAPAVPASRTPLAGRSRGEASPSTALALGSAHSGPQPQLAPVECASRLFRDVGATAVGRRPEDGTRRVRRPQRGRSPAEGGPATAPAPRALDTTAQLRQSAPQCPATAALETANARDRLRKRATAKAVSEAIAEGLVALGDRTPLKRSYASTLSCTARLVQDGRTITAKWCGQRWCVACNRIRTAKAHQRYGATLASWDAPQFVTLTLPNCVAGRLHPLVRDMLATIKGLALAIRRTDGLAFAALRKVEVTFNAKTGEFHPHFHLVVQGTAAAAALVRRWLEAYPDASPAAQDVRPADNPAELLKYVAKLVAKIDGRFTAVPAVALDTIFKALKGLRTLQPMGFKGDPNVTADDGEVLTLDASTPAVVQREAITDWVWHQPLADWVDAETGEVLVDHDLSPHLVQLLANIRADALANVDRWRPSTLP
jgi:hypothetical protein